TQLERYYRYYVSPIKEAPAPKGNQLHDSLLINKKVQEKTSLDLIEQVQKSLKNSDEDEIQVNIVKLKGEGEAPKLCVIVEGCAPEEYATQMSSEVLRGSIMKPLVTKLELKVDDREKLHSLLENLPTIFPGWVRYEQLESRSSINLDIERPATS